MLSPFKIEDRQPSGDECSELTHSAYNPPSSVVQKLLYLIILHCIKDRSYLQRGGQLLSDLDDRAYKCHDNRAQHGFETEKPGCAHRKDFDRFIDASPHLVYLVRISQVGKEPFRPRSLLQLLDLLADLLQRAATTQRSTKLSSTRDTAEDVRSQFPYILLDVLPSDTRVRETSKQTHNMVLNIVSEGLPI